MSYRGKAAISIIRLKDYSVMLLYNLIFTMDAHHGRPPE